MPFLLSARRSGRIAAAAVFATLAACWLLNLGDSRSLFAVEFTLIESPKPTQPAEPPSPKYQLFGLDGFDAAVDIATFNIRARPVNATPPLVQDLPHTLPPFSTVRLDSPQWNATAEAPVGDQILDFLARENQAPTFTVDVASPKPTPDGSHLLMGCATTLSRMPEALEGLRHWAPHTGIRFVFMVEPYAGADAGAEPTPEEAVAMYEREGISVSLVTANDTFMNRYVSLVGVLNDHLDDNTTWAALIDDDTFFLDPTTLLGMLARYDASRPYYVGRVSENQWNVNDGGLFAIGGAGVFMTVPLLRRLAPHAAACVALPNNLGGDARLGDCIFRYTPTKLSLEHGLFQLDLHGDVTGFYEAAREQPVSVHHWRSWHHHDMPTVAAVSRACGRHPPSRRSGPGTGRNPACVLQKFRFADGWYMTNGFSVVRYGYNATQLSEQVPEAMEHTWKLTIWDIPTSWKYSLEPLKPKDENKVQFLIEKVDVEEGDNNDDVEREEEDAGDDPEEQAAEVAPASTSSYLGVRGAGGGRKGTTVTLYYVRRIDGVANGVMRVRFSSVEA